MDERFFSAVVLLRVTMELLDIAVGTSIVLAGVTLLHLPGVGLKHYRSHGAPSVGGGGDIIEAAPLHHNGNVAGFEWVREEVPAGGNALPLNVGEGVWAALIGISLGSIVATNLLVSSFKAFLKKDERK